MPHDTEHRLQGPYEAQFPSTAQSIVLHPLDSVAGPAHEAPPYCGFGLLHTRVRIWTPPPHDFEQAPNVVHMLQTPLIGQGFPTLQGSAWVESPTHDAPPLEGGGLLHALDRFITPQSHDVEQGPKSAQLPHSPLT